MKITVSQLRRIIKEEISRVMIEAPLEDITPAIHEPGTPEKNRKAVAKFSSTPAFKAKAKAAFRTWPQPVYMVPATVVARQNSMIPISSDRSHVYEAEEGLDILKSFKLDYEFDKLKDALAQGGTVFINGSAEMGKDLWPTPWMMIHAVFDAANPPRDAGTMINQVYSAIELAAAGMAQQDIVRRMTMGSARGLPWGKNKRPREFQANILDADSDLAAELITQALITTSGVEFITRDWLEAKGVDFGQGEEAEATRAAEIDRRSAIWKPRSASGSLPNAKNDNKMNALKAALDALNLKERFINMVKGKVVFIGTTTFA